MGLKAKPCVFGAVTKVFAALDALRARAQSPTICLLPDVMDLSVRARRRQNGTSGRNIRRGDVTLIDGHAAIGLLTLSALRHVDSGLFRIAAVIRGSGDTRRQLRSELRDLQTIRGCEGVLERGELFYQLSGTRSPRIDVPKDGPRRTVRDISPLEQKQEMNWQNVWFEFPELTEVLAASDVVGLLNVRHAVCAQLLEAAILGGANQIVFVDTETFRERTETERVRQFLFDHACAIDVVSVSDEDAARLMRKKARKASPFESACELARALTKQSPSLCVLYHTDREAALLGQAAGALIRVPSLSLPKPRRTNGAGDTFNAAWMLAAATMKRSARLGLGNAVLTAQDCLLFACAVAGARIWNRDYATKDDVFDCLLDKKVCLGADRSYCPQIEPTAKAAGNGRCRGVLGRFCGLQMAALAQQARHQFQEFEERFGTAVRSPLVALSSKRPGSPRQRRAAIINIDGTLIDSQRHLATVHEMGLLTACREAGSWPDLGPGEASLLQELQHPHAREARQRLAGAVYHNHMLFERLLQVNVRYRWNDPRLYAATIAVAHFFRQELDDISPAKLRDNWPGLRRYIESRLPFVMSRLAPEFASEGAAKIPLEPIADVPRALTLLRDELKYDLYLLSEGIRQQQWRKIEACGLSRFFSRDRFISYPAFALKEQFESACRVHLRPGRKNDEKMLPEVVRYYSGFVAERNKYVAALTLQAVLTSPEAPWPTFSRIARAHFPDESPSWAASVVCFDDRPDGTLALFARIAAQAGLDMWLVRLLAGRYEHSPDPMEAKKWQFWRTHRSLLEAVEELYVKGCHPRPITPGQLPPLPHLQKWHTKVRELAKQSGASHGFADACAALLRDIEDRWDDGFARADG